MVAKADGDDPSAARYYAPAGLTIDLGLLTAFDERPAQAGLSMHEAATQATQHLVHALLSHDIASTADGKFIQLPRPVFALPREKPIPRERAPTKWEVYAAERGISKRKSRDRLVLDEQKGEYVPRYGKGSKTDESRDVVIPHKDDGMGVQYDPFTAKRDAKRKRVRENRKQEYSNIGRARKAAGGDPATNRLQPMQALNVAAAGPSGKKFLPKKGLSDSLAIVQKSTASAGKFDRKVAKEPKQKSAGRKKKLPSTGDKMASGAERIRLGKIADRVMIQKKK